MQIPSDIELLDTIDAFLTRHAMRPSRFGREATGEPQLIKSIRDGGRSPSLKVLQRLAQFMNERDEQAAANSNSARDLSGQHASAGSPLVGQISAAAIQHAEQSA